MNRVTSTAKTYPRAPFSSAASPTKKQQSGVVLVGGLFFMVVMTLIGVAMVKNIALEEKIASNSREKMRSFEAAEIALKISRRHLNKRPNILSFYATGDETEPGLYSVDPDAGNQPWQDSDAWSGALSLGVNDVAHLPADVPISQSQLEQLDLRDAPRYMIGLTGEQVIDGMDSGIVQRFFIFTVTSRANSNAGHIGTTLQTRMIQPL